MNSWTQPSFNSHFLSANLRPLNTFFLQRFFDVVLPSIGSPLSDHYGVKVRLSNIRDGCNFIQKCRYHCVSEIKGFSPFQPNFAEVCF